MTRMLDSHTPPTVKPGDVLEVHVPELPGLWRVDAVLHGDWGYFLRIAQLVDGAKVIRTIAPRGYRIVTEKETAK